MDQGRGVSKWCGCALLPLMKGTLSGPPTLDAAAARHNRSACAMQILSPLLAPATSLSIIFIACSPLVPRSAPFPANACVSFPPQTARFSAHRMLPKSTVGDMCLAPPPWSPARPTSRVLWRLAGGNLQRIQAFKRGCAMLSQTLLTAWQKMTAVTLSLPRRHPRPLCPKTSASAPPLNVTAPSGLLADLLLAHQLRFQLSLQSNKPQHPFVTVLLRYRYRQRL